MSASATFAIAAITSQGDSALASPALRCHPDRRFRRDLAEEGLKLLLKATIDTAVAIQAVQTKSLERVIADMTVQEKAIAHPTDNRLLEITHHKGCERRQARRHQP